MNEKLRPEARNNGSIPPSIPIQSPYRGRTKLASMTTPPAAQNNQFYTEDVPNFLKSKVAVREPYLNTEIELMDKTRITINRQCQDTTKAR